MATAEAEAAAMAQQITRVVSRDGWKTDRSIVPDMQKVLSKLTTLKVDVDLLRKTNIGAMVRKLEKHEDEIVRGYSSTLTKKWMSQVGVAKESGSSRGGSSSASQSQERRAPSSSPPKQGPDAKRLENARKRLQEGYASEKARRESRTLQVLSRPVAKGRKGTTISAAPSRSSLATRTQLQRKVGMAAPQRASISSTSVRRALPLPSTARSVSATPQNRRPPPSRSSAPMTEEERHRLRQEKYKRLQIQSGSNDRQSNGDRESAKSRPSSSNGSTQQRDRERPRLNGMRSASAELPQDVNARKAYLDKLFPRVCGVSTENVAGSKKSSKSVGAPSGSKSKSSKQKPVNYTEGQREVIAWLKGLDVDMSEYAPAFFDNGFDSIKLLTNVAKEDLPTLVPKIGHHRLIQRALDDLRRKNSTAASARPRSAPPRKKESPYHRRRDPFSDEDSDDSFVVDDGDSYAPGAITAMFRKNRKRRYSIDSSGSSNMEATFDEIQHEEERSKRYGELEDYEEEIRNKKLLKKKKK